MKVLKQWLAGLLVGCMILGIIPTSAIEEIQAAPTSFLGSETGHWHVITEPVPDRIEGGTTRYQYVKDTDGLNAYERYLIVDHDSEWVVENDGNSAISLKKVNPVDDNGTRMMADTRDYEWTIGGDGRISTQINGTTYYLYSDNNTPKLTTNYYGNNTWFNVQHRQENGDYLISSNEVSLNIANDGTWIGFADNYSVRLYRYEKEIIEGGITIPGEKGLYAKVEGSALYNVTNETSAEDALQTVKDGITGYICNAMSVPGANDTVTVLDDSQLTFTWIEPYDNQREGKYAISIAYQGIEIGIVRVAVPGVVHNYHEYPEEGAVKVSKTGTGIDFQSSGIAQVEIAASGVPVQRGMDVIVMLDSSSSMRNNTISGGSKTREVVLEESLAGLIANLKKPSDDGMPLDIRVAIADFNGFYGGNNSIRNTPYDREEADRPNGTQGYNATSTAEVYTGTRDLTAGAFIDVSSLPNSYDINCSQGTNYDYAMDAIYQLGTAVKSDDRDLIVIFMSDGATMQWNYYHSLNDTDLWNKWLTGEFTGDNVASNLNCTTHAYYYDEVDHDGDGMRNEHRMANAIKGDPKQLYEVVRKQPGLGTATNEANMYKVPGLGAKMFAIAFDISKPDGVITIDSMRKSIASIASDQVGSVQYFYEVKSAEELDNAFDMICEEIEYAAYDARFVDQLGPDYNLQLKTSEYKIIKLDANGKTVDANNDGEPDLETKKLEPVIEILTYDIYTKTEADDSTTDAITSEMIGTRKGTSRLIEAVKFDVNGTKAYSTLIDVDKDGKYGLVANSDGTYTINDTDDNIYGTDLILYAKTFIYNNSRHDVTFEGVDIPTGVNPDETTYGSSNRIAPETFYWKMDTITYSELAMRYYVYLDGSMEGTRAAGSYPTNNYATLYYKNDHGNSCRLETVSPTLAWKAANVSYAFYLVNENGEVIVNQSTGETGTFAHKIALTKPVVYQEIMLNSSSGVAPISLNVEELLPQYYDLYDSNATYTVSINSNSTGSWTIGQGDGKVSSTYVTNFSGSDASAYSNELINNTIGDDYTHTVVWFAVVWSVGTHPDTVVIDYGIPVDISVLSNDLLGEYGDVDSVGPYTDDMVKQSTSQVEGFGESYNGVYGKAEVETEAGEVRYSLYKPDTLPNGKTSVMQMNGYEKFAYGAKYHKDGAVSYFYDTVTVIPATTIYYEDDFLTYGGSSGIEWETVSDPTDVVQGEGNESGGHVHNAQNGSIVHVQDEDRPGGYSLNDANNIYGYDSAYKEMSVYSLGSAKKVHISGSSYATAQFSFYGTGFDVISMTTNTTGVLAVQVKDANNDTVAAKVVDTYYGYALCNVTYTYTDGKWARTVGEKIDTKVNKDAKEVPFVPTEDPTEGTVVTAVEYVPLSKLPNNGYVLYNVRYTYTNGEWARTVGEKINTDVNKEATEVPFVPTENPTEGTVVNAVELLLIPEVSDSLYQVPVLQIEELPYGKYTVVITATYSDIFNHTGSEGYDLYLDAIRIYDPANDGLADGTEDKTIENAYEEDSESLPSYIELRNKIIAANSFDNIANSALGSDTQMEGLVFIDGDVSVGNAQIEDYKSYGPNNEIYLAPGQRIAFMLATPANIANVHIGVKSADGGTATYTITNVAKGGNGSTISAGTYYGAKTNHVHTSTDMYYDLTEWKNDIIVISNTGDRYGTTGILSLTNIKSTYKSDPGSNTTPVETLADSEDVSNEVSIYMTPAAVKTTLDAINIWSSDEKPDEVPDDEPVPSFVDVQSDDYFYDPVYWAVKNKITTGTDTTHFSPNSECTRAQMVTFLYREAGEPDVSGMKNPFVDVKESDYFYKAVLWAVKEGITTGTDKTHFSPDALCTRAQMVTFLYREVDGSLLGNSKNPFVDVTKDAFYYDATLWAVENGITTGVNATHFAPDDICSRGQAITFIYRTFK